MKVLKYIPSIIIALLLFACTETSMPIFDSAYSFVYFENSSTTLREDSKKIIEIPVTVSGVKGEDVTVTFSVKGTGNHPAQLGTDYLILNPNNKVTVKDGTGLGMIRIEPINDEDYTYDKTFEIQITDNDAGFFVADSGNNINTVKIIDDDIVHPLSFLFGDYEQNDFNYEDGSHDDYSPYNVYITYIDGSETQLSIQNFWGEGHTIIVEADLESKTINILPGQIIYIHPDYGDCYAVKIDTDTGGLNQAAAIPGTFDDDGNITFGPWMALVDQGYFGQYLKTELTRK